ncbi:hypothetical protein HPB48_017807 [Haemaphysalis longicornis]|uniref:Uncharacterized protein n=1 Tax=Haemaphysalis longicornis TaxID=44386 RepID=A0A9J6FLF3_HAELO|nr:hypothetical protein HPB48_017807 [Haemaphysalis longicornis]
MRKGEKTQQGNLWKPSRQDALDFVAEAWSSVPEKTVTRCRGCSISNALDGCEEGDLHEWLSDIGAVVPEDPDELQTKGLTLIFGSYSKNSFEDLTAIEVNVRIYVFSIA